MTNPERRRRAHLDGHLEHDTEEPIARAEEAHLLRIVSLRESLDLALRRHQAKARHVGADLAELAGKRAILGRCGGKGADRHVADLGHDVELQSACLQRLCDRHVSRAGFDCDGVGVELENAIHRLHVDHGAAVVAVHAGGGVHRSRRPDRRGKARRVAHDGDEVFRLARCDQHPWPIGPRAVPVPDRDVLSDFHQFPLPPVRRRSNLPWTGCLALDRDQQSDGGPTLPACRPRD